MSVSLKSGDLDSDPEVPFISNLFEVESHVGFNFSDSHFNIEVNFLSV